ncbi:MAG: hypothetical protein ABEI31_06855 [Halodesulfurarchaeum sp.]
MAGPTPPRVVIVAGEEPRRERYRSWLQSAYPVETAPSSEQVGSLPEGEPAVILVEESIAPIENGQNLRARVSSTDLHRLGLIATSEPVQDVVTRGFDGHVSNPATAEELESLVRRLHRQALYLMEIGDLYQLVTDRAAITAGSGGSEAEVFHRPDELEREIARMRADMQDLLERCTSEDFRALFRDLDTG